MLILNRRHARHMGLPLQTRCTSCGGKAEPPYVQWSCHGHYGEQTDQDCYDYADYGGAELLFCLPCAGVLGGLVADLRRAGALLRAGRQPRDESLPVQ